MQWLAFCISQWQILLPQALHERLDNLERIRLPAMDSRIQHAIEAPLSQVCLLTLRQLTSSL